MDSCTACGGMRSRAAASTLRLSRSLKCRCGCAARLRKKPSDWPPILEARSSSSGRADIAPASGLRKNVFFRVLRLALSPHDFEIDVLVVDKPVNHLLHLSRIRSFQVRDVEHLERECARLAILL